MDGGFRIWRVGVDWALGYLEWKRRSLNTEAQLEAYIECSDAPVLSPNAADLANSKRQPGRITEEVIPHSDLPPDMEEPDNNEGEEFCYWCNRTTERLQLLIRTADYCHNCER